MRARHVLPKVLSDFRIEEDALALYFSDETPQRELASQSLENQTQKKRRARRKRNRMKTRGWEGKVLSQNPKTCWYIIMHYAII